MATDALPPRSERRASSAEGADLSRLVVERLPPQNLEAEQSVLGAMLLEREGATRAIEVLRSGGFYREGHQKIYEAILTLAENDAPADLTTVAAELTRRGQLEAVGGAAYLADLVGRTPTAAHTEHYARLVRDKAIRRGIVSAATRLATEAYEEGEETGVLLDRAEAKIFELAYAGRKQDFVPLREAARKSIDYIQELSERKGYVTGVPSGFHDLDQRTAGFQKSDLIVLAARPSVGKSALALNIAANASLKGKSVAMFSLEMSATQLVLRLICSEARVNLHAVRTGHLAKPDWTRLIISAGVVAEAPIFIDDSSALSILDLRSKARRLKSQNQLDLVIVDYLQLIRPRASRQENRQQEVAEISRSLKALAKELDVPVLAVSQLSRATEQRDEGVPRLSDLRESGAIEQDADLVLFIVRESFVKREGTNPHKATINVAKQRNGPAGPGENVDLYWHHEYTRFDPWGGDAAAVPPAP